MDIDILSAAEEILGPAVRVERHRSWAVFWCPFHNDSDRAGQWRASQLRGAFDRRLLEVPALWSQRRLAQVPELQARD